MTLPTKVVKQVTAGPQNITETSQFDTNQQALINRSVPRAFAGTVTTQNSAISGILTVAASPAHTIEVGDFIDIYSAGGVTTGAEVTAKDATTITFITADAAGEGAGGKSIGLPVITTPITVMTRVTVLLDVDMDNAAVISFGTSKRGCCIFSTLAADDDYAAHAYDWAMILQDGDVRVWTEDDGTANPLTGDTVAAVHLSHDDTAAATMRVTVAID